MRAMPVTSTSGTTDGAPALHGQPQGRIILSARHLSAGYNNHPALEDISFDIQVGEHVALVGPNGAGKTTLLKVIAGTVPPRSGRLEVHGHTPTEHSCVAYLPQRQAVDWSFPVSVWDVVMMGRAAEIGLFRRARDRDREHARASLRAMGLEHLASRQIGELSGGEQQRMFVARALAQESDLFLMDEPLAGLDVVSQQDILEVLDLLRTQGVTVIAATHDLVFAAERFDNVLLLNRRLIGAGRPTEVLTADLLARAYGGHVHVGQGEDGNLRIGGTWCAEDQPAPDATSTRTPAAGR